MGFLVNLIVVAKEQTSEAMKCLRENCTYIDNNVWIYEGIPEILEDEGVIFKIINEGTVPCLGDMTKEELIELCKDVFDVDIYTLSPSK